MRVFSGNSVEQEIEKILEIPEYMMIAYAVRLGYLISEPTKFQRVRREVIELAHHNRFGNKGFV
jgi:hypothetical protein